MSSQRRISPAHRVLNWLRHTVALVAACTFLLLLWQTYLLYTDTAPFHKPYFKATPAQDAIVTRRLAAATVGLPLAFSILLVAAYPAVFQHRPRRCLRTDRKSVV